MKVRPEAVSSAQSYVDGRGAEGRVRGEVNDRRSGYSRRQTCSPLHGRLLPSLVSSSATVTLLQPHCCGTRGWTSSPSASSFFFLLLLLLSFFFKILFGCCFPDSSPIFPSPPPTSSPPLPPLPSALPLLSAPCRSLWSAASLAPI